MTTPLPQAVYRRIREPNDLPRDLRMLSLEWALYFATGSGQTVFELGRRLRADDGARDAAISRLLSLGLIVEEPLDAPRYLQALAASGDADRRTLQEFLVGALDPGATRPGAGTAPAPDHPVAPPGERAVSELLPVSPTPRVRFKPLPLISLPEGPAMTSHRKLSLRAVMNLIETNAGSREAGQLDIYRVFIRVDTQLLRRSGIETLHFTDDRLISDQDLQNAIVRSIRRTLALDCPDAVWVDGTTS